MEKRNNPLDILPHLLNSLDLGEASVIQLALDENITNVCIDEDVGRRIARLNVSVSSQQRLRIISDRFGKTIENTIHLFNNMLHYPPDDQEKVERSNECQFDEKKQEPKTG